jgi:hypothetical protein
MRGILRGCCAGFVVAALAGDGLCAADHPSAKFYLRFSGDGQYVEIPSAPDISFGREGLTISAWLRPERLEFSKTEGSGYVYWMGKGERNQQEWALRMYSYTNREKPPRPNRISFYLFNLDGGLGEGSYFQEPVRSGEWIHVMAVAGEGNTSIYKNGAYMRCDEYNGRTGRGCQPHGERILPGHGNAPLRLGTRDLKSFFQGELSQVRIWKRALRSEEVRQLYTNNDVPQQGLAAEFLLDEGKGDIVHDTAGGHQGKIVGATWAKAAAE